jgi:signal transduction histidine kinase
MSTDTKRCLFEPEPAQQEWLADLGELVGPVAHEVNNFLNSLLLHLAVLDQEASEDTQAELAEIRRQGTEISAMLRTLQEYQNVRQSAPAVVDLNAVIRQTVLELQGATAGPRIALELTPDPLAVVACFTDLRRLCRFLVKNAITAAIERAGSVTIGTEGASDKGILRVEDTGPAISQVKLTQIFEPHLKGRPGTNTLELAACQTLVLRLQGSVRAESGPEFGLRISVSLPLAPP